MIIKSGNNPNVNHPLRDGDSLIRTIGCRHSYPELCKNNDAVSVCAFARKDGNCLAPPGSWKKIFPTLLR